MARNLIPIWFDADNDVTWTGAYAGGAYLNAATVTWSLKDSDELEIASGSLSYVAASNGNYLGTIDAGVTDGLTINARYFIDVVLVQGGYRDSRRDEYVCTRRPGAGQ